MATTARTILSVPGLAGTSPAFRAALYDMAERNGWDVDAIAGVMSIESGFRAGIQNPTAGVTASGLIQFTDNTAKGLGIKGGAAEVRRMSGLEQLPWIEKFYRRAFAGRSSSRPADFYLAGFGSGIGGSDDQVLASESDPKTFGGGTQNAYTLNRGLDVDADGQITVGDVAELLLEQQEKAGGRRVSADPVPASSGQLLAAAGPVIVGLGIGAATLYAVRRKRTL